jgi:hypothetical protein
MRPIRILVLLALAVLGAGCGLPDSYYIQQPLAGTPASTLNAVFQILGTTRSNDILVTFMGYELYYKLYGADDATLTADKKYGTSDYTATDLTDASFQRLCLGQGSVAGLTPDTYPGTASAPSVNMSVIAPAALGTSYTINIVFNDPAAPDFGFLHAGNPSAPISYFEYVPANETTPTAGMEVRRFVQADPSLGNACATFASNSYYGFVNYDFGSDADLTYNTNMAAQVAANGGNVFIMIYAVSYGKADDGTAQQSYPVYLGYTQLPVTY